MSTAFLRARLPALVVGLCLWSSLSAAHELGVLPDGGFVPLPEQDPNQGKAAQAPPPSKGAEGTPDGGVVEAEVVPVSPPRPMESVVKGKRDYTAASSAVVRNDDFASRPLRDPSDILEVTPGLFTVQHAGGGKANQYFLRGFDLDHGTDLALSVDGVPVNMVSHAHGQGYADLHFVIPETVARLEVQKGPYAADRGDFATAGAANLVLRRRFDRDLVQITHGSFDTWRGVLVAAPETGEEVESYLAAELYGSNGPFDSPERTRRVNVLGRATYAPSSRIEATLTASAYAAGWNASGQIPLRAVEAGTLDRFGSVDPTEGGASQRHSVSASVHHHDDEGAESMLQAYLVRYRLDMFSNFTFFAVDPVNGDQIEQRDARTLAGLHGRYRRPDRLGGVTVLTTTGVQLRNDEIDATLFRTAARERLSTVSDDRISESSLGAYLEEDVAWNRYVRTVLGLRADLFSFGVDDRQEDLTTLGNATSGSAYRFIASPKASLVVSPLPALDLFVNFGRGFHSNDARGVVRRVDSVTPLAQATGYEVGARTVLGGERRLDVAVAAWGLDLASEIVWVGDESITEAKGASRRVGLEAEARLRLLRWLRLDADVTWTRARFREDAGGGRLVPLAPEWTAAGGVEVDHRSGFFGSVRLQHLGDRPAIEDGSLVAEGFTLLDVQVGFQRSNYRIAADVKNALDAEWRQAQFANASRLPGETEPVEDLHFTPGEPLSAFVTLAFFF